MYHIVKDSDKKFLIYFITDNTWIVHSSWTDLISARHAMQDLKRFSKLIKA